jgi:hypothetical protein
MRRKVFWGDLGSLSLFQDIEKVFVTRQKCEYCSLRSVSSLQAKVHPSFVHGPDARVGSNPQFGIMSNCPDEQHCYTTQTTGGQILNQGLGLRRADFGTPISN